MSKPARRPRLTPDAPPFRLSRHATLRPWARGDTLLSVHVDDEHALLAVWRHERRAKGLPRCCPVRLRVSRRPWIVVTTQPSHRRLHGMVPARPREPFLATKVRSGELVVWSRSERLDWFDRLGRHRAELRIGHIPDAVLPTPDGGLWLADDLTGVAERDLPVSALVRLDAIRRPVAWLPLDEDPERLTPGRRRSVRQRGMERWSAITRAGDDVWGWVSWPGDILGTSDRRFRRWKNPDVFAPNALLVEAPWVAQIAGHPPKSDEDWLLPAVSDHVDLGILVGDHWERVSTLRLALPDGTSPWEAADTPRFLSHGPVLHVVIGRAWYRADLRDYLPRTAPTNADTFSGSFTDGADSIPLLTSTA